MSNPNISAEQLKLFIERIETVEEEKRGVSDALKDVYAEAKSEGFDVRIMREIVRRRRMELITLAAMDALLDTYLSALGMDRG